jgi:hypothetical protein
MTKLFAVGLYKSENEDKPIPPQQVTLVKFLVLNGLPPPPKLISDYLWGCVGPVFSAFLGC